MVETIQGILTSIAIVVGAVWTYYKFFKGRTYRPRLEATISGSVICRNDVSYLLATAQLKNVGLSKVSILRSATALVSFTYQATNRTIASSARDQEVAIHPVFEAHGWIEPDETIEDQRLLAIPECQHLAFRLELKVASELERFEMLSRLVPSRIQRLRIFSKMKRREPERISWTAVSIVNWESMPAVQSHAQLSSQQERKEMESFEHKVQREYEGQKQERLQQAEAERLERAKAEQQQREREEREREGQNRN